MKKITKKQFKLTPFFIAFLAIALVFLAVGMGTLGSFTTYGEDFALKAPAPDADGNMRNSTVVFRLDSSVTETYLDEDGKEQTRSVSLTMADVYLYTDAIYTKPGTSAEVSVQRSSSSDKYFGGQLKEQLGNLYTDGTADASQEQALYRWVHPFKFTSPWAIATWQYWELSATTADIRVAEVLFVGKPSDETKPHSADRYLIPARVVSATPDTGETAEQARTRAEALIDAQPTSIPTDAVSSYDTFVKDEYYSLLTVTEMRVGDSYTTDIHGQVTGTYLAESVYNVLGMDLVAFGTLLFGVSPFGLRFMPMLFSFGILVLGFFFVKKIFKSDRAGFLFALLYALCDVSLALGHVGTPLTAGLFFLLLAAYLVDSFYRRGVPHVSFRELAPLLFGGLSAAAICVNGAMLIPVLAVCGLYAAGMIRQKRANTYYLDKAIEACEARPETEEGRDTKEVAKTVAKNRYRLLSAGVLFPVSLILGTFIFSLLFILPVYSPLVKLYDDPAASTANVFSLGWKAFVGGFVGVNDLGATPSAWNLFYRLFAGTGESFAVTASVMNGVAVVCGLFGIGYAVYKIVTCSIHFSEQGKQLRRILPLVAGLLVSLVTASFGGGSLGFVFLAYIFSFMLAAYAADDCMNCEGKVGTAAKALTIAALVLLLVCFALFAVPLPATFMTKFI